MGVESPLSPRAAIMEALVSSPGYGLDIIERVRERGAGIVTLRLGSVYAAFRALERDGLVRGHDVQPAPGRGGRPRRYYALTTKGHRAALAARGAVARFFDLATTDAAQGSQALARASTERASSEPTYQAVPLAAIRRDATRTRAALNADRVAQLLERISEGDRFPAPVVFFNGTDYWLADGFHRMEAYSRTEYDTIECDVREGNGADAILFGAGANAKHDQAGLYRSNADKRHAVVMVFQALAAKNESWTDTRIAKLCGVSNVMVVETGAILAAARAAIDAADVTGGNAKRSLSSRGNGQALSTRRASPPSR